MAFNIKRVTNFVRSTRDAADKIPGVSDILGNSPLGDFFGLNARDVWRLKMVDSPYTEFRGQFRATNLTENVGAKISDSTALNSQKIDRKYISAEGEYITFSTKMYATYNIKNISKSITELKNFCRRDEKLKRAPIFKFSSGTEVLCTCFVKTVGNIRYSDPRPDGTIREATFDVVLMKIEDLPSELGEELSIGSLVTRGLGLISSAAAGIGLESVANFLDIPGGSLHRKGRTIVTKDGQTFEHISKNEYGNALYGDVLRRVHYNKPLSQIKTALDTGDVIDLVDDEEIKTIKVTPQCIPLKRTTENLTNIKDHFERRGEERTIYV